MLKKLLSLFKDPASEPADTRTQDAGDPPGIESLTYPDPADYRWRSMTPEGLFMISGEANSALRNRMIDEAAAALRLDLALAERVAGPDAPELIDLLTTLANLMTTLDGLAFARRVAERALAIADRIGDDSKASNALLRLCEIARTEGNRAEALELLDLAIVRRRAALGDEHQHTIMLVEFRDRLATGEVGRQVHPEVLSHVYQHLDHARATIPTRRMYLAEQYAQEALNVAVSDLGNFSAEALEAQALLGEILLSAHRPNAARLALMHACDMAYVREGEHSEALKSLLDLLHDAEIKAPDGDYDPEGGSGMIAVSRSPGNLHAWLVPHRTGEGHYGAGLPPQRPVWGTISADFAAPALFDAGWELGIPAKARRLTLSFTIDWQGQAQDGQIERSSGSERLDQLALGRLAALRFAAGDGTRYQQDVVFLPIELDLGCPEPELVYDATVMILPGAPGSGDFWGIADPDSDFPRPAQLRTGTIDAADYPSRALREELEGVVEVSFVIGTDGRPTDLAVTGSSGHESLDEATVSVIRRRFRYRPALDEAGNPVAAPHRQSVRWQIPD